MLKTAVLEENMAKLLKGLALYSLARKKAGVLGIGAGGKKLDELIHIVQQQEGHEPCFKRRKTCDQKACCWQLSCGASLE